MVRLGRPFVRALVVTFSWLERAPGVRGRRRRATRALSELLQPNKMTLHAGFLVRLQTNHAPSTHRGGFSIHRAVFALWNAPIQQFGLQRFALNTDHVIPKSDVALTLFGLHTTPFVVEPVLEIWPLREAR